MISVILLDDERPALKMLEIQLGYSEKAHVVGSHISYKTFLDDIKSKKPDIAFIDIEMPGMSGLETAREIQTLSPHTEIVFTTAHKQYAFDAYQMEASDYILKPVRKERLKRIIDKVNKNKQERKYGSGEIHDEGKKIQVNIMKRFEVRSKDGEIIHWRTRKVEELFAYLVHLKGEGVTSEFIIDALWPDENMESAKKIFYTTIYYLRNDLKKCGASVNIISKGHKYILSRDYMVCDVWQLEECLSYCTDQNSVCKIDLVEELFNLYRGGYMEENYYGWAEKKRLLLEEQLMNTVLSAATSLLSQKRLLDAAGILKRLIDTCPYRESPYELMIKVYRMMNERAAADKTYQEYCKTMTELGIKPREKII